MKSQSIACLLNESEHVYWIMDLENEMQSIWDLQSKRPSKMQGQCFFSKLGKAGNIGFGRGQKIILGVLPRPPGFDTPKVGRGVFIITNVCPQWMETTRFKTPPKINKLRIPAKKTCDLFRGVAKVPPTNF